MTAAQRDHLETVAIRLLEVRDEFPDSTLAELYSPLAMPEQLVHAHDLLDRAVITVFRGASSTRFGVRPTWCALRALRRSAVTDAGSSEDDEGTENSSLTSRVGPSYGCLSVALFRAAQDERLGVRD